MWTLDIDDYTLTHEPTGFSLRITESGSAEAHVLSLIINGEVMAEGVLQLYRDALNEYLEFFTELSDPDFKEEPFIKFLDEIEVNAKSIIEMTQNIKSQVESIQESTSIKVKNDND